jgi:hypothetical protein
LIFPAPPKNDKETRKRWRRKKWDPDFLESRLIQLGNLSRRYDWGREQHKEFQSEFSRLMARFDLDSMAKEANGDAPYEMTRMLIAQDHRNIVGKRKDVKVVAAYQTGRAFKSDFQLRSQDDRATKISRLIRFMIHVPDTGNEDANLETAISIARNKRFQRKRRSLYEWQERVLEKSALTESDVEEFNDLEATYNDEVKSHVNATRRRFAFTLAGIGLSLGSGGLLGALGASVVFADFATTDYGPTETGPTAMFHHIDRAFGRG